MLVNGAAATSFTGRRLADGLVSFQHDGSETTTASFDVSVEDGDEATSTPVASTFYLTVTPVNDPAVFGGTGKGAVTEDLGPAVATGTLTATDADGEDEFQAVASPTLGNNAFGTYTITTGGDWTYTLDNGHPAVNALATEETLADSFTVLSADGTPCDVTITISVLSKLIFGTQISDPDLDGTP